MSEDEVASIRDAIQRTREQLIRLEATFCGFKGQVEKYQAEAAEKQSEVAARLRQIQDLVTEGQGAGRMVRALWHLATASGAAFAALWAHAQGWLNARLP